MTHTAELTEFPLTGQAVVQIPTSRILPNPAQPRRVFTDSTLASLSDSIRRHGVLEPLLVRGTGDYYELIAGERRLRASIAAGLNTVPCIIRADDPQSSAEIAIIENLQREDLNMFEEADAIRSLIAACSMTQESAAARLSCSQSYIANKLRLLKLPPEQRQEILEAELTERHARALLRISDDGERQDALEMIIRRHLNVAAAEELVEKLLCERARKRAAEQAEKIGREAKRKMLSRDMRLFYNSIDKAVRSVKELGFDVESDRHPTEGGVEISILIREGT